MIVATETDPARLLDLLAVPTGRAPRWLEADQV